jgi:hypothetical protein
VGGCKSDLIRKGTLRVRVLLFLPKRSAGGQAGMLYIPYKYDIMRVSKKAVSPSVMRIGDDRKGHR